MSLSDLWKRIRFRKLLGVILGAIIVLEGVLIATNSSSIEVLSLGVLLPRMTMVAGVQLAILGLIIAISWALKDNVKIAQIKQISDIIRIAGIIAPTILVFEGIFVALNVQSFLFDEGSSLNQVDLALLSFNLFSSGMLSLGLWIKRERDKGNYLMWFLGIVSSIFLMAFGLMLVGCNAAVTLDNTLIIPSSTVLLGGISLLLFGTITFIGWLLIDSKYYEDGYRRIINMVFYLSDFIVILLAVMMVMLSSNFEMGDFFIGRKVWFAYWSALIFFFGTLSITAWIGKDCTFDRKNAAWVSGSLLALLFPTEGILIMGMSGQTIVQGVGIIYETNAFLIGYPFIALGINLILSWHIHNNEYFQNDHNRNMLDMMFLFCQGLLFLGGLMIIARASTLIIEDIGSLSETVVMLFGAQLSVLGLIGLSCWIMRKDGSTPRTRRVLTLGLIFLILLIPPAFIM